MLALIVASFHFIKVDFDIKDFAKLYGLEGEWVMPTKDGELVEIWQKSMERLLVCENYSQNSEQKIPNEKINLFFSGGRIYLTPSVKGQNNNEAVTFDLVDIDKNKFIFENKDHDFPQRIVYVIKSADNLYAYVEGDTKKGFKKIEYNFKRRK